MNKKVKRILIIVLFIFTTCCIKPVVINAADGYNGEWEYRVSSGEATIVAYNGNSTSVVIPTTVDNYPVTEIGSRVFYNSNIREVTIPKTIESIQSQAFANCQYLTNIYFNAKNCKVYYMRSMMDLHVFVNAGKFSDSLTVTFGPEVVKVPDALFEADSDNYAHVSSVVMSNSITDIGRWSFSNCYDLADVTWGTGITTIGEKAFSECINLKSIVIPDKTESIGAAAFANCKKLTSIEFNATDCNVYYMRSMMELHVFVNAGKFSDSLTVSFGSKVKKIPKSLFEADSDNYAHITSVTISKNVKSIGNWAFNNCYDLQTLTIYDKLVSFPNGYDSAFSNCSSKLVFNCFRGSTAASYADDNGFKIKYIDPAPAKVKTIVNKSSGIKLSWTKSSGATGYYVYRKIGNSKWKKIKTTKDTSWLDTSASKNGTKYQYKVYAYNKNAKSAASSIKVIYRLSTPSISKVKNSAASVVAVDWSRNSKASGYQIKYVIGKTTKIIILKNNKTTKCLLKNLKKRKTYHIQVRSYKMVSGKKYYSDWSKVKSIKVKK